MYVCIFIQIYIHINKRYNFIIIVCRLCIRHYFCAVVFTRLLYKSADRRKHASGGGRGHSFVGLSRGFVACRSLLVSALFASGSVLSGLPQSSMPTCVPQFSLLLEPSTAVVRVCCGTVIRGRLDGRWSVSSLSDSPQQRPRISVSASPFSAARGHNSTRTAIIFVCVDSFIQALSTKHMILTPSPVTRSHAHELHLTSLVTASAARYLAGSSSRSGYLTLAV